MLCSALAVLWQCSGSVFGRKESDCSDMYMHECTQMVKCMGGFAANGVEMSRKRCRYPLEENGKVLILSELIRLRVYGTWKIE